MVALCCPFPRTQNGGFVESSVHRLLYSLKFGGSDQSLKMAIFTNRIRPTRYSYSVIFLPVIRDVPLVPSNPLLLFDSFKAEMKSEIHAPRKVSPHHRCVLDDMFASALVFGVKVVCA